MDVAVEHVALTSIPEREKHVPLLQGCSGQRDRSGVWKRMKGASQSIDRGCPPSLAHNHCIESPTPGRPCACMCLAAHYRREVWGMRGVRGSPPHMHGGPHNRRSSQMEVLANGWRSSHTQHTSWTAHRGTSTSPGGGGCKHLRL